MKLFYPLIFTAILSISLNAQKFAGKVGNVADNATTIFDLDIVNLNNQKQDFGLESVQIDIEHSWASDLNLTLITPSGERIKLATALGGSSQDYKNTIFDMKANVSINDADAPFTGSFKPQGNIGTANRIHNYSGKWQLEIVDTYTGNVGLLKKWSLVFGRNAARALPIEPIPNCLTSTPAGDT